MIIKLIIHIMFIISTSINTHYAKFVTYNLKIPHGYYVCDC
jgi:hypothetical protein